MMEYKKINSTYDWKKRSREIAVKAGNIIVTVYFLVMMVIYPFFVGDGYWEIGTVKYLFFRNASLIATLVMILVTVGIFVLRGRAFSVTAFCKTLSVTDWFIYVYFMSILVSYIFTPFTEEAFWGADGWYMGFVSQLLFVAIYFMFSRYFRWNAGALYTILVSSALIFLLGILNRYSIYPIEMSGQNPGFISMLGNINWFCGYWAVICPIGVVFYWNCTKVWQQVAAGAYVVIAFITGVVQGSSSAYLVLAVLFIFLFAFSFRENKLMCRFLQLCMLFALSCQIARLLRYLPGFDMNYEDGLGIVLTDSGLTIYIGIIIVIIALCFHYVTKQKNYKIERHKNIRKTVIALLIVLSVGYVLLLVLNSCLPEGFFGLYGVPAFTFNDEWASYRGATWTTGVLAYREMSPLYKLVGMGPDCFAQYIYSLDGMAQKVYSVFGNNRLTNAHNEWITLLVNQGLLGLVSYAGIFISAVVRFLKKAMADKEGNMQSEMGISAEGKAVLYMCAISILAYTVHNMVSFQQILNAPFVFVILGIGEGIWRKA